MLVTVFFHSRTYGFTFSTYVHTSGSRGKGEAERIFPKLKIVEEADRAVSR